MAAKHLILVQFDGEIVRIPREQAGGRWLVRFTVGANRSEDTHRYFMLAGYACQRLSDDRQEGAIVYIERPKKLYEQDVRT